MNTPTFSFEKFDIKLNTDLIGRNFLYFDELDSTNTHLLKESQSEEQGTVVFAEKQNKGRGRFDREWIGNSAQNLYFSILIPAKKKFIDNLNRINLGASLSVANAIETLYTIKTEIKWPNDVLVKRKKICGILMESLSSGSAITRIVAGIGVNVNQVIFQGDFALPPTSIKIELGEYAERERLLAEILNNFEEMLNKISDKDSTLLREWRNKCGMIGERIEVQTFNKKIDGVFVDIDDDGLLLLKDRKGMISKISIGDVSSIVN